MARHIMLVFWFSSSSIPMVEIHVQLSLPHPTNKIYQTRKILADGI